jgi:hypothetical protein
MGLLEQPLRDHTERGAIMIVLVVPRYIPRSNPRVRSRGRGRRRETRGVRRFEWWREACGGAAAGVARVSVSRGEASGLRPARAGLPLVGPVRSTPERTFMSTQVGPGPGRALALQRVRDSERAR